MSGNKPQLTPRIKCDPRVSRSSALSYASWLAFASHSLTILRFTGEFVTALVGPKEVKYLVHRGVLLQSDFFRKALDGHFEEARSGCIRLVEDDTEVFATYLHWLYTGDIPCEPSTNDNVIHDFGVIREAYFKLISLYCFGHKIWHVEFMNATMNALIHFWQGRRHPMPLAAHIKFAYDNLPSDKTPLHQWLVDVWSALAPASFYAGNRIEHLPQNFVSQLLMKLSKERGIVSLKIDLSTYHIVHLHKDRAEHWTASP